MTRDHRNRIIEILKFHGDLIGNDSAETDILINQMKQVGVSGNVQSIDDQLKDELRYMCDVSGYELTPENNKSRKTETVAIRDAIAKLAIDKFKEYSVSHRVIAVFFEKDQSMGISIKRRCEQRLAMKDPYFMHQYESLIKMLPTIETA